MAKIGEILNRVTLQRVAELLKIGNVKQYPTSLNLDDVKLTFDLSSLLVQQAQANPNAGQGQLQFNIVSPAIAGLPFLVYFTILQSAEDGLKAFRIDSCRFHLNFDVAGNLAFVGKKILLTLMLKYEGGDPGEFPILTLNPWVTVEALTRDYYFSLKGGVSHPTAGGHFTACTWPGRIPADLSPFGEGVLRFAMRIEVFDGTNFPANTTLEIVTLSRYGDNGVVPVE